MKTPASAIRKAEIFANSGYELQGYYMFLPRQEAARRAIVRALGKTKRYVPPDVVLSNATNEATFDLLAKKYFKYWAFYDNQGRGPVLLREAKQKIIKKLDPTFSGSLKGAFDDATSYVLNKGKKEFYPIEYASIFNNNGKTILRKKGSISSVKFNAIEERHITGGNLVHNHPSSRPLSSSDLRFASRFNLSVTAAGHDGTTYIARGFKEISLNQLTEAYRDIQKVLSRFVSNHQLTAGQAVTMHHHLEALAFQKAGYIKHYTVLNEGLHFRKAMEALQNSDIDADGLIDHLVKLIDLME